MCSRLPRDFIKILTTRNTSARVAGGLLLRENAGLPFNLGLANGSQKRGAAMARVCSPKPKSFDEHAG
jgi:hypothetical protein